MKSPSVSETDVQNTINAVANAGGGVCELPAGTAEYKTGVDLHPLVSFIGDGDATHIIDSVPKDGSIPLGDSQAIRCSAGAGLKFGAFKIEGNTPDVNTASQGHIRMWGITNDTHIFNLTAVNNTTNVIRTGGAIFGLVEKCKWDTWRQQSHFIQVDHGQSFGDTSGFGDKSWCTPINWGSFESLYIENCEFTNHLHEYNVNVIDNFAGGRVVFRKNKNIRMTLGSHGTETGGRYRSMRYYEVYDNTFDFIDAVNGVDGVMWLRGGLMVVFRNKVLNARTQIAFNTFIKTNMKREEPNTNYGGWGWCGGNAPFDQNQPNMPPGMEGYYCIDQPGADTSRDLGGIDPPEQRWAENQVGIIYEWENELSDTPRYGVIGGSSHLKEGQDYMLNTKRPGYVEAGVHPLALGMEPLPEPPKIKTLVKAASCSIEDIFKARDIALTIPDSAVLVPPGTCTLTEGFGGFHDVPLLGSGAKDDGTGTVFDAQSLTNVFRHPLYMSGFWIKYSGDEIVNSGIDSQIVGNVFENKSGAFKTTMYFGNAAKHPRAIVRSNEFIGGARILVVPSLSGGDEYWHEPSTIGTLKNAVFIEDNVFRYPAWDNGIARNVVDSNAGGRYVFRKNTVYNAGAEAHSLQGGGNSRGTRSVEIYDNDFIAEVPLYTPVLTRAGSGVIFNNRFIGPWSFSVVFDNMRSFSTVYGAPPCNGNDPRDGNTPGMMGWPCRDQIGRGEDTAPGFPQPQSSEPFYVWDNKLNGVDTVVTVVNNSDDVKPGGSSADIVAGRDYYNIARAGYTPAPYPHPEVYQVDVIVVPPDPEPEPEPEPIPNESPKILKLVAKHSNGSTIDPTVPITQKFVTLYIEASDDVGVTYMEIAVNGQVVKVDSSPDGNPTTMTFKLNTQPYKRLGAFTMTGLVKDAEGATTGASRMYLVKK